MKVGPNCKKLIATYRRRPVPLGGPHKIEFKWRECTGFHIRVEQYGLRRITISAENEVPADTLYKLLMDTEKLLMLFEGTFIPMEEITLDDSTTVSSDSLSLYARSLKDNRVEYCIGQGSSYGLVDFEKVLTSELFAAWKKILYELDISYDVYLYTVSGTRMPVDMKLAFLVEQAEPMCEIVNKKFNNLAERLKNWIERYGKDIFEKERLCKAWCEDGGEMSAEESYNEFIAAMKNSRVRIMHIKGKQAKACIDGEKLAWYSFKMDLLYRKGLLEMIGVDENIYADKLKVLVSGIDDRISGKRLSPLP